MQLFVGLGNPGPKYAGNRHNVGYMAVDQIAKDHGFAPWRAKFDAQFSEGRLGREKIILLKPETFMNNSGQAVGKALRFFKLDATDVTVFQDEIDLAPGKCRAKDGGGHAGLFALAAMLRAALGAGTRQPRNTRPLGNGAKSNARLFASGAAGVPRAVVPQGLGFLLIGVANGTRSHTGDAKGESLARVAASQAQRP